MDNIAHHSTFLVANLIGESLRAALMASMHAILFYIPGLVVRSYLCDMYEGVGEFFLKP